MLAGVAVRRQFLPLDKGESEKSDEVGVYLTGCPSEQHTDAEMMEIIRGHGSAIENGTHHRRDVSLGEDACGARDRVGASVLASLRNLAIGVYELEKQQERTKADSLPSWRRKQGFGGAMAAPRR